LKLNIKSTTNDTVIMYKDGWVSERVKSSLSAIHDSGKICYTVQIQP